MSMIYMHTYRLNIYNVYIVFRIVVYTTPHHAPITPCHAPSRLHHAPITPPSRPHHSLSRPHHAPINPFHSTSLPFTEQFIIKPSSISQTQPIPSLLMSGYHCCSDGSCGMCIILILYHTVYSSSV